MFIKQCTLDIVNFGRVSKRCYSVSTDNVLWRRLFYSVFEEVEDILR